MREGAVVSKSSACQGFHTLDRRVLLRAGSLSLLGLGLGQMVGARRALHATESASFGKAKACILLFMWGGPAQQDTWDMKPDQPENIRGAFKPISTKVPGIQICEHLPQLAQRTDRLALVRSVTHNNADHTQATHFLLTGQPPPRSTDLRVQWPHM